MNRPFKLAAMMLLLIVFAALFLVFVVNGFNFDMSWWDPEARALLGVFGALAIVILPMTVYNCSRN